MKYTTLLLGSAMLLLTACHQYPSNYGNARMLADMPEKRLNTLTTQAAPLPWSDRKQWLENYVFEVNFEVDSARMDPMDAIHLKEFAERVDDFWSAEIFIEGHADSTGNSAYNQGLAERRGYAVRDALIEGGVPSHLISVRSFGDRSPIANNVTQEGRKKNRRAVVVVAPSS